MTKLEGKRATNDCLQNKNQVALIGFWKKDQRDEFHCYNFFYVPNPCVREYARSERFNFIENNEQTSVSICQILFKGGKDDLFLIFNTSKYGKNLQQLEEPFAWRLGILNLEKQVYSEAFTEHDYISAKAFEHIFPLDELKTGKESDVKKFIQNAAFDYKQKVNPTFFKRSTPR